MLYFILDPNNVLFTTFTLDPLPQCELFCPFCNQSVDIAEGPFSSVRYYVHIDNVLDCRPSLVEQLFLYFTFVFPDDFSIHLPTYEHTVPSVSAEYPNHPGKFYYFASKNIKFSGSPLNVFLSELVDLNYSSDPIKAYSYVFEGKKYILIFNFFNCDIDTDFFDDLTYFTSTVLEMRLAPSIDVDDFEEGITLNLLLSLLKISYLRNELVIEDIQAINRQRQEDVKRVADQQSLSITRLTDLSILRSSKVKQ